MAPVPSLDAESDRPDLPRVRLAVRTGTGRTVEYEVGGSEFLIGGAAGCDLRLPVPNLPPVVCQITRKPDGATVRRLATGLTVLHNEQPLPATAGVAIADGDRLAVSGIEIVVVIRTTTYLSPSFTPLAEEVEDEPPPAPPLPVVATARRNWTAASANSTGRPRNSKRTACCGMPAARRWNAKRSSSAAATHRRWRNANGRSRLVRSAGAGPAAVDRGPAPARPPPGRGRGTGTCTRCPRRRSRHAAGPASSRRRRVGRDDCSRRRGAGAPADGGGTPRPPAASNSIPRPRGWASGPRNSKPSRACSPCCGRSSTGPARTSSVRRAARRRSQPRRCCPGRTRRPHPRGRATSGRIQPRPRYRDPGTAAAR